MDRLQEILATPLRLARGVLPGHGVHHPVDVDALARDSAFVDALGSLADELGRNPTEVLAHARSCLRELSTAFDEFAVGAWQRAGAGLTRAYDVVADEVALARLRELDRTNSLVFLPSHRSYLDIWVLPGLLASRGFSPAYGIGGANLDFFPFGTFARRTGVIFIRRTVADDPVYKLVLRAYIGQLVRNRVNLAWAIEGGRTRTGKLRAPRYGLLRYLIDALDNDDTDGRDAPEPLLVPVSIVYDQLHEVANMTAEARGGTKSPEDIRWLISFALQQSRPLGHVYVDVGEPIRLRESQALHTGQDGGDNVVERIALEVCHRINSVTPVTPTAVVTLALLSARRALALDEVVATLAPTARYVATRRWPVAGGADLTDPPTVAHTLAELTRTGVLTAYEEGIDTVWQIAEGQHLIAAFYRNTVIHLLVNRAIAETALITAAETGVDDPREAFRTALALRDLLKFEFFFAGREEFGEAMRTELALIDPDWETPDVPAAPDGARARRMLQESRPHVAHLVLRPFLDAYLVVAERLAASAPDAVLDEDDFLHECLTVGRQWALQGRLASQESVTLELFRTALRLARHRSLWEPGEGDLAERRDAFAAEVRDATRRVAHIADLTRSGEGSGAIGGGARETSGGAASDRAVSEGTAPGGATPGGNDGHRTGDA